MRDRFKFWWHCAEQATLQAWHGIRTVSRVAFCRVKTQVGRWAPACRRAAVQGRAWGVIFAVRSVLRLGKLLGSVGGLVGSWSATLISFGVAALFWAYADPANLKLSETSLAAAQIIGSALALILSLSIVPAQRAAENYTSSILRIYAADRSLLLAFLSLVATTTVSALLGVGQFPTVSARKLVFLQFVLLGLSFDVLRRFYLRALDLLDPQTTVKIVVNKCETTLKRANRIVERTVRVNRLSGFDVPPEAVRIILHQNTGIKQSLVIWTGQLEEFAHRFLIRKETSVVREIVQALETIAKKYADARKSTIVLQPDLRFLFLGARRAKLETC
jgi:hypothetical protein